MHSARRVRIKMNLLGRASERALGKRCSDWFNGTFFANRTFCGKLFLFSSCYHSGMKLQLLFNAKDVFNLFLNG